MPVYELSTTESRSIPGPVNKVECLVGQVVVVDPITKPATTTTLSTDETYDAEGHAGLTILDIDGSRVYVEYSLSPNAPLNADDPQVVVNADTQPRTEEPRGDNDPEDDKQTGSYESRSKAALYELAKERDLDVDSHSSKAELVAALRG